MERARVGSVAGRRTRLRQATDGIHRRIDAAVAKAGFLATREGYGAYVMATRQARGPVEQALDEGGAGTLFACWSSRRILADIDDDIVDLGLAAGAPGGIAAIADRPMTRGALLGSLYVLEGSALGAQFIGRTVAALGMGPHFGARHLARQTAQPKAWPLFLSLLEYADLSRDEDDACVEAALAVFERFDQFYAAAA
jgi:heme oxygenase